MNLFENKYILENFTTITTIFVISFLIAFLLTPWVGKFAKYIGALDLPAKMRNKTERGYITRVSENIVPKLGGIGVVVAFLATLLVTGNITALSKGLLIAILIIVVTGFIDDRFDASSKIQLLGQIVAAFVVVISGISITSLNFLGLQIEFNWFSGSLEFFNYIYHFVFPADLITILWIVGMINVINWVSGVDALNGSVTAVALITLQIITLGSGNIVLAILITAYLGGVLGVLPYNYNPAKIFYGSIGDYLNGFLLAIFAILGSNKWSATLILLGMPIIDGMMVVYMRFKSNPELLKQPLKILQISDKNHLHHRLLAAGYSRKAVTLLETTMMAVISVVVIYFNDVRSDFTGVIVGFVILLISFTAIFFLKQKNEKVTKMKLLGTEEEVITRDPNEPLVKVVLKEESDDKKFVY